MYPRLGVRTGFIELRTCDIFHHEPKRNVTDTPPPPEPSDADILQGCRDGDEAAWQRLVSRYERLVYSIPLRLGLSRDDASEVFQQSFATLLGSIDAVRDPAKIGGWLATVARRHAWRIIARGKVEVQFPDESEADEIGADAALLGRSDIDTLERQDLALWLAQGLAKLGGRCQNLLQMLYFDPEPPSYAELARRVDVPIGSIGPTRARCLEQLRKLLHGD
jgi:RNA polymerase sigma factor (sigma-70 family)